jgi:hypothetical protein
MADVGTVTSTAMVVTCPHCEAEIEVQLQAHAAVAPPAKLPFASADEFALWLKASALSVEEFQRLPVYEWHRDQLEPLVKALADAGDGQPANVRTTELESI